MIRFELGNQICVCLSENDISLEINNTLHHAIPVSSNEYAILSTIATYGSLNAPISQRVIERKITQHYKMALPENGFKNAVAALRKKFRKLTEDHVSPTRNIIENIHRTGYFIPFTMLHTHQSGIYQQKRINQHSKNSVRKALRICLRNKRIYTDIAWVLLVTTAIFFSVCYYAINSIVKHNYLDSALDIADSLSQMSCYADEDQLKGLFDNVKLVESSMMLDRFNIRCLVTPEAVVPVSQKAFNEWSDNSNYTTQSFDINNATILVRVKNINLQNNVESHISRFFLSGMKLYTNTGTSLEIGNTNGRYFHYQIKDTGYKEVYYISGPFKSIILLSLFFLVILRHRSLQAFITYLFAIREFHIKLEPIYNTSTQQNIHYEALSRFKVKNTQRFIETLISNGLLLIHTILVIRAIYAKQPTLLVPISINVCPSLLRGRNFSTLYQELVSRDCRLLTIEITENASMYYTSEIYDNVAKLKLLNCKISIDDFGTGNNNVSLISKINPDYLKIDREFVIGLKSDDKKVETLRQLIAMGNTYRCTVIVEGVETADSAHLLTTLGAYIHQGYFYPLHF
ncbi:TPA: EAL domain-containing protein [Vibrio parahaemolyticus]|uniref:cyclic di-GMP phosphodiesterase TpdA n=1 Tax=Vibrio parahaemolyticus TaxID=670 RepID=UPI0018698E54|nr:EAL domain-containing protein [Vibrio parahaemolyticus]MBE3865963.1 EAL domain-containing protein [Vibrio parahaemolyticus]MCZ5879659.1 EAL domain-containing protein [Vibrio parahaemolyticus]MCZ6372038.1 EAL domain-containing protein [Vibrio parahaemolyticus]MDG3048577.1 EAL domain-containing protein [Vibrio parahaemolyticus]HBC3458804.1 EAL domain-containing protein [Vibrio parahaemolyticus]